MFGVFYLQSEYSLLNNLIPLPKLVELAKEGNYDFVALSDTNNLYGMYDFFKLAKKHQLKPVIGLKIEVNFEVNKTGFLVYVKNDIGYQNLLNISAIINIENRDLEYDELVKYQEGLIIITSGLDSIVDLSMANHDIAKAHRIVNQFKRDLEDFYIGLLLSNFNHEIQVAPSVVRLALDNDITILPIQKTSYINESDKDYYRLLKGIDSGRVEVDEGDLSFLNKEELEYRFLDYNFVFKNVSEVIKDITFDFMLSKFELPNIETNGLDSSEYLKKLSFEGLEIRLQKSQSKPKEEYVKRLEYELSVINNLGYSNYFLIVSDFVRYAKQNDILVGPGRGSGASSLVAYCLDITEVDPLEFDLLFERFLNPARISMPDIDLDFPDDKRDQVIEYVANKYGVDHIASIITFDTFQFNSSIRDIARVKGLTVAQTNYLIDNIKRGSFDSNDEDIKEVIAASNAIIGLPRHTGTHPAGIILSSQNLREIIPLQAGPSNFPQTQWNMNDLEEIGLLKIDFLGIKNLTIIDETVKLIKKRHPNFDLDKISYSDEKTYQLLQIGDTNGVFQLEQGGMQNTLRKIFPTKFEDLVATLALYRPGPMANIDIYARRLKGEKYDKINPILDEILKPTYGVIVYQEQIMQIANQFAGYTYAEADLLRRSISKKDLKTLKAEESHFIESAKKVNRDEKLSKEIYDYIVKFADYGFNRAHSVSYAIVTYQMAYLKANYFQEFATVLLSNNIGNENLTQKYLQELRDLGYKLLPPSINKATNNYQIFDDGVMLPLNIIKSIGRETVRKFLEVRDNQPFKDYQDFKLRTMNVFGERNLENLIFASSLDKLGLNKKTMHANISKEGLVFGAYLEQVIIEEFEEDYKNEKLVEMEKQAYGFNIFYNEFNYLVEIRKQFKLKPINEAIKEEYSEVVGLISNVKEITTKTNKKMAFIAIRDDLSSIDITAFPGDYDKFLNFKDEEYLIFKIRKRPYNQKDTYILSGIKKVNIK